MAWRLFQLTYELRSPLHIGYHKVGNVQRTRYYVPARNLWGAVTERLTRSGFQTGGVPEGDYREVGQWVKNHVAFSYLFVRNAEAGSLLYPRYTDQGLCYGARPVYEFERRFLSAHVTTALDAATTSAEDGSLHEVEYIVPYDRDGNRTKVQGRVFLDETASKELGDEEAWRQWLGELQVGGERRYGFGQLRLTDDGWREGDGWEDGYRVLPEGMRPQIEVKVQKPLMAHTLASRVNAQGMIEPLVGRETIESSERFGHHLTPCRLCWTPGTVLAEPQTFTLSKGGLWEAAEGL